MAERYTYNAIAEHPIIPEFDDNEEKFKWNGALLNLSDLPFSEYTKTVFQVSGSTPGPSPEPTGSTKTNVITVECVNTGDTYEVVATLQYPSESQVMVMVTVSDVASPVSVIIPAGSITAKESTQVPTTSPRPTLSNPSVDPVKDDTYTYQVTLPEPITDKFKAYYGVILQKRLSGLTSSDVLNMDVVLIDVDGMRLTYEIPSRDVEITEQEVENYKYALILAIPKSIYDGGNYSFLEHTFQSPSEFVKKEDMVLGTSQYTVLDRTSEGMQFVSRYMATIEYEFDLKYVE